MKTIWKEKSTFLSMLLLTEVMFFLLPVEMHDVFLLIDTSMDLSEAEVNEYVE